jgi:hypothetical protein
MAQEAAVSTLQRYGQIDLFAIGIPINQGLGQGHHRVGNDFPSIDFIQLLMKHAREMRAAILDSKNAEACCRMAESFESPEEFLPLFGHATLAGVMESFLLAARHPLMGKFRKELREVIRAGVEPWKSLSIAWYEQHPIGEPFEPRAFEFRKIKNSNWESDASNWNLFEQRFLSGLRRGGFSSDFAHGVLKAFHEMSENVTQHATFENAFCEGLAAYHVEPGRFAFSVGDLGCGFLRSLQESDSWRHLQRGRDALDAVIHKGASRRTGQGEGEGFKELWKALADHGALVRIRSGNAAAKILPTLLGREAEIATFLNTSGSHISVYCCLGEPTLEEKLNFTLQNH